MPIVDCEEDLALGEELRASVVKAEAEGINLEGDQEELSWEESCLQKFYQCMGPRWGFRRRFSGTNVQG